MLNGCVTVCTELLESMTLTVKLNVPAAVGVPVINPVVELMANPGGSDPALIDHVYEVAPPLALTFAEYETLITPLGREVVVIDKGAGPAWKTTSTQ